MCYVCDVGREVKGVQAGKPHVIRRRSQYCIDRHSFQTAKLKSTPSSLLQLAASCVTTLALQQHASYTGAHSTFYGPR